MSGLVCVSRVPCSRQSYGCAAVGVDLETSCPSTSFGVWQRICAEDVRPKMRLQCARKGEDFSHWKQPNPTREDGRSKENKVIAAPVRLPGRRAAGKQTISPPGLGQFRPPPLPGSSSAPTADGSCEEEHGRRKKVLFEQVRDRVGKWQERAEAIVELQRSGVTAEELSDATYVTTVAQTAIVVAAQVYDSLLSSDTPDEVLHSFHELKLEILYALRILSARQRKPAAEFIFERGLDLAGAQELARAIKEHERRPQGREGFTSAPGDCLAYMLYQAATETKDLCLKRGFVERALDVASSETAKARFDALRSETAEVSE